MKKQLLFSCAATLVFGMVGSVNATSFSYTNSTDYAITDNNTIHSDITLKVG